MVRETEAADEARGSTSPLRRRRTDTVDTAGADAAHNGTQEVQPVRKKPKVDEDEELEANSGHVEEELISSESTAESTSAEDGDAADHPTVILPDDSDEETLLTPVDAETDADTAMEDDPEIPQTPPATHAMAIATASGNGNGFGGRAALKIDPPGSVKSTQNSATAPSHRASVDSSGLLFRHRFPLLSNKSRVMLPAQRDVYGQEWRVVWYPHGQYLDDQFVSVFVEMLVDESSIEAQCAARLVIVEIKLVHPRDPADQSHMKKSNVIKFTKDNHEFGVEKFMKRTRIVNPTDLLISPEGNVDLEVRLHFIVSTEVEIDANEFTPVSPGEDGDELVVPDTTPVVTPTGASGSSALPTRAALTMHDLMTYDSKKETGMVGLKNQGATCYMNSLLQTLFHLRAFRHIVYATPTEQEDTNDSVSLALQRVFYRLQRQSKAVSTKELTRSFGWSQMDAFMQHDVQELYRILCDRLEEKMKNTSVDNTIKRLFEGKVRSFVQCVNVDFQSFRDESFYDLQLDVKGCKDIYESFRKYVEIEMLDGDNQYEAEGHGKQDAKKGVLFQQFPPVLNIQLKRFEYDPMRDGMVKIHDRFEFPKTLILDDVAPKESTTTSTACNKLVYRLHSVLVHSGDVHGGHYYVYIRPGKNIATSNDWFKFDDDQISRVDEQVAIEGSYGSSGPASAGAVVSPPLYTSLLSPENGSNGGVNGSIDFQPLEETVGKDDGGKEAYDASNTNATSSMMLPLGRSFSSAYMLVYIRDGDNDVSTIQDFDSTRDEASTTQGDESYEEVKIPDALVERFHEEEKAAARRKKQQQTEHLYMTIRIASDTSISKLKKITKNIDFSTFGNNGCIRIRLKRASTVRQLHHRIYRRTGVPVSQQRLWKVITRENRTHRPDTPLTREALDAPVEGLIDDDVSPKSPVRLYLQIVDEITTNAEIKYVINRHYWGDFTPPDEEKVIAGSEGGEAAEVEEDEDDDVRVEPALEESEAGLPAPNVVPGEILLFIKFYDLKKPLGDRLEYKGNILVDSRTTGAQLAKYLHEALDIPFTTELALYEEIQPTSVSAVDMDTTLGASEIQDGDIICYQYAEDVVDLHEEQSDAFDRSTNTLVNGGSKEQFAMERYPDVPSYFRYLLDRVDVMLHHYGHPDEAPVLLHLLYSNVYDEIIDAVVKELAIPEDRRLYVRLYQHSPLNGLPKKAPLRHSKYAGDDQTTLDDFLTEYSERTNAIYYEMLANPITEIESKKQVVVCFSIYDDCFIDPNSPTLARRLEFLLSATCTVRDLLDQVRQAFELDPNTALRAVEVSHNGTLVKGILEADASLEKYWSSSSAGYSTGNEVGLFVERISDDELDALARESERSSKEDMNDDEDTNELFTLGVVHFAFQLVGQAWIHPHGVPCVTYFHELDTVKQVKERIRRRMNIPEEVFAKWELAFVQDIKASTLTELYDDMEPEAIDNFTMSKFEELCGGQFENIASFGLEYDDPKPATPKYNRRIEQGIRIRQS